ncbi:hypothetical protein KY331_04685 [Candidatus Woesearchaeota archaeon]|nr:hypothetical protein [Candidatus Woesearchaeota archaeon]
MKKLNKKAMVDIGTVLWKQWAEVFFIILLLIGFLIAVSIKSAAMNYVVIFLGGLMAGRLLYEKKGKQPIFAFFLIIVGFLFGYMLGSFAVNKKLIVIFFIAGTLASYYIHKKGYIKILQ